MSVKNVILQDGSDDEIFYYPKVYMDALYDTDGTLVLDKLYPVGSVFITTEPSSEVSPANLYGGTWERITGRFLYTTNDSSLVGTTGGNADSIVVSHTHNITQNVNGTIQYYNNGVLYGQGSSYTSAPGSVSGNISLSSNANNGLGSWANSGSSQRGRDVYATYTIPAIALSSAGESITRGNMPPYLTVLMWRRIS